jgi:hypothetical protein
MRALGSGIPRGFKDSRSKEAVVYRRAIQANRERLGELPKSALPLEREYGRAVVELERLGGALDEAVKRRRRRDASRLRRQLVTLRTQFLSLERRLEELADDKRHDLARRLTAVR